MQIANDVAAFFHYTLTDENGNEIDSSLSTQPLGYLHGHKNIIPGLEKELEGKVTGDKLKVTVKPEDAYGARHQELVQQVSKTQFDTDEEIEVGMQFQANGADGEPMIVTVVGVDEEMITLDGNHPLAGVTLTFDVEITEVRTATQEELDHGHVHGPGGHNH